MDLTMPKALAGLDPTGAPVADGTYNVIIENGRVTGFSVVTTLTVQDENANVSTAVVRFDFQGGGVTVTSGTGEVIVTIPAETLPASLIDAKGDLIVGSAADTAIRKAVGSNNQVVTADSAATGGLKWATPTLAVIDTTGASTANVAAIVSGVLTYIASSVPAILLAAGSGAGAVPGGTPVGTLVLVKA